ncbi:hypothetical protein BVY01_04180 [bacterium I07]|nr:hypothetical protein BVY01_04180 [bacterium I07]
MQKHVISQSKHILIVLLLVAGLSAKFTQKIYAGERCKKAYENCLYSPMGINWQGLLYCAVGYIWCITWISE